MSPGRTSSPRASSTRASSPSAPEGPTAAIRPSSIRTSAGPTVPATGSTTVPPATSSPRSRAPSAAAPRGLRRLLDLGRILGLAARDQQVEDRHAHGDAVGHLAHDHGVGPVGHLAGDLEPAVERPGMEDDHVRLREPHHLLGEAVVLRVLVEAREEMAALPLAL